MGTVSGYPQRVPRRVTELNAEQKKLLTAFHSVAEKIRNDEARYRELLIQCEVADVPIAHIAKAAGVHRKTIYSQLKHAREVAEQPDPE